MYGKMQSLVESQLLDTKVFVNTLRTQIERLLSAQSQLSPCIVQLEVYMETVENAQVVFCRVCSG